MNFLWETIQRMDKTTEKDHDLITESQICEVMASQITYWKKLNWHQDWYKQSHSPYENAFQVH